MPCFHADNLRRNIKNIFGKKITAKYSIKLINSSSSKCKIILIFRLLAKPATQFKSKGTEQKKLLCHRQTEIYEKII